MARYIVQARFSQGGRLVMLGEFDARTHAGAIVQAARIVTSGGEDAFEFVATPAMEKVTQ